MRFTYLKQVGTINKQFKVESIVGLVRVVT